MFRKNQTKQEDPCSTVSLPTLQNDHSPHFMDESVSLHRRLSSVESSSEYNMTKDGSHDGPLSSDSGTESNRSSDLTASTGLSTIIRVLSDSLLRTELAEMEMMKAREAARWEAEKRRMEMEVELTRMVLQTHLQLYNHKLE
ncbi:hypothetical protein HID58_001219 [Brassica napus]|uniref:GTD-binding domain-containing protein n=1 Tax=Brassica napus TaxID=3708 RepID=A0ABQ8EIQ8_BRANA|nr:hypothetical protein HID58_001219 [Brassica napus]